MANYATAFAAAYGKYNHYLTLPTGQRQWFGASCDYAPMTECEGCVAHAKKGGTHAAVGSHWCAAKPMPFHLFPLSLFRQLEHAASYLNWLGHGWPAADENFQIASIDAANFGNWQDFKIVSATATQMALEIGDGLVDPRSFVRAGMQLSIGGNSVLTDRICARLTEWNFSTLGANLSPTDIWVATVDQNVSAALYPSDPDAPGVAPFARIAAQDHHPEYRADKREADPMWVVEKTVTYEPIPANGIITLKDDAGADCAIAWPIADNEPNPATLVASAITGTFKLELDAQDKTGQLRVYDQDNLCYWWPRVVCDWYNGGWRTRLFLGATDANGNAQASLIAGKSVLAVRYCYQVANGTVENAYSPNQKRCLYDLEDYGKLAGNRVSAAVKGVGVAADGRHFCCAARKSLSSTALATYQPGKCWKMGSCPYFRPGYPRGVWPSDWALLFGGQGMIWAQISPGSGALANQYCEHGTAPGLLWLANPATVYSTPASYFAWTQAQSGGFIDWDITTYEDGSQDLVISEGAIENRNATIYNLVFPSMPDTLKGLFARDVSTAYQPLTQLGNDAYTTTDEGAIHGTVMPWWRTGRQLPPIAADIRTYGSTFTVSRSDGYLEGEARVERFNRTTTVYIPDLSKATTGTAQVRGEHAVTVYSSAQTVDGFAGWVKLQLSADGADFPAKIIDPLFGGTNSTVMQVDSLGGGLYKVHAELGYWPVYSSGSGADTIRYFRGGGTVARLPWPYAMFSHYANASFRSWGPPSLGAIAGDTLKFTSGALSGKSFWIKKAEPCGGANQATLHPGYPAGLGYPSINDISYLKNADALTIQDDGPGQLAGASLTGSTFSIYTDGVIHPTCTLAVSWAEKGSNTWTGISSSNLTAYRAAGAIWLNATALAALPANFCLKITG